MGSAHPTSLMARLNTKLESEAAEFLVLGHLLLEGISAFKTYTNFPGYDLIATDAANNTSARIQVKSRYRTDYDGFIIKNFDCDFVVLVTLNRGFGTGPKKNGDTGIRSPEFFVMPIDYIKQVRDPKNDWGKINKKRLVELEKYKDKWRAIKDLLQNVNKVNS
ncbi:MAG: hypothetical protein Q8M54_07250 [Desulfobaccales bacterium]|nr:hypothetical protein [Desulfobaccales bacterium]